MTNRNGSKGAEIKAHRNQGNFNKSLVQNLKLVTIIKEKNIVRKREVNQKGVNHFTPF